MGVLKADSTQLKLQGLSQLWPKGTLLLELPISTLWWKHKDWSFLQKLDNAPDTPVGLAKVLIPNK